MSQPPQGPYQYNDPTPGAPQYGQPQGDPYAQPATNQPTPAQPAWGQAPGDPYAQPTTPAQPAWGQAAGDPYAQPAAQPTWGQPAQPWGQPYNGQPGQAYQGDPHGQAPYPPAAYGQSGYSQPLHAAPAGKKSGTLGVIGFAVVLLAAIGGSWASYGVGASFGALLLDYGLSPANASTFDPSDIPNSQLTALGGMVLPIILISFVGLIGWVVSIVATARNSARPLAIVGIVLGVLAPVAMYLLFGFAAAMVFQS
jgi:hypothetical protein